MIILNYGRIMSGIDHEAVVSSFICEGVVSYWYRLHVSMQCN